MAKLEVDCVSAIGAVRCTSDVFQTFEEARDILTERGFIDLIDKAHNRPVRFFRANLIAFVQISGNFMEVPQPRIITPGGRA
jgi:hypothetical protein